MLKDFLGLLSGCVTFCFYVIFVGGFVFFWFLFYGCLWGGFDFALPPAGGGKS